jgi:hypothetical protein
MAFAMVTSRDVTARIAEILPDWPVSDLRTRERWLIQAGVVPRGKPGRGGSAAPITLRHALLYVVSLGAPKALGAPKYVRRTAGSVGADGQTLIESLEYAVQHQIAVDAAYRNDDRKAGKKLAKDRFLVSLELPCWDGKKWHAASIQWHADKKGHVTEPYHDLSNMRRRWKAYEKKWRGKKKPKPPMPGDALELGRVMKVSNPEPHAMRWVRMDHAVIDGVAALFAEVGAA